MSLTCSIETARSARIARRAAIVLATGAMALGVAVVPGAATAATPAQHTPLPVAAGVAVKGGATTFTVPAELLAELKAKGLTLAQVNAKGKVEQRPGSQRSLTLGITSGTVSSASGRAAGRLSYSGSGFAVVHAKAQKAVRVNGFEADLAKGTLRASVNGGQKTAIGAFERPMVNFSTVDVRSGVLSVDSSVRLTAATAARLNRTFKVDLFAADTVVFNTRSTVVLDKRSNLRTAFAMQDRGAFEPRG